MHQIRSSFLPENLTWNFRCPFQLILVNYIIHEHYRWFNLIYFLKEPSDLTEELKLILWRNIYLRGSWEMIENKQKWLFSRIRVIFVIFFVEKMMVWNKHDFACDTWQKLRMSRKGCNSRKIEKYWIIRPFPKFLTEKNDKFVCIYQGKSSDEYFSDLNLRPVGGLRHIGEKTDIIWLKIKF